MRESLKRVLELTDCPDDTNINGRLDSLSRVEVIMDAEEKYGVSLTDEQVKSCKTAIDLQRLVEPNA